MSPITPINPAAVKAAHRDLELLAKARQTGHRPFGVWLFEPMPGNMDRMRKAIACGCFAVELPLGPGYVLRPIVGLPVWLYATSKASPWLMELTPHVVRAGPVSLYAQYRAQPTREMAQVIIRHPNALKGVNQEAILDAIHERVAQGEPVTKEALQDELSLRGEEFTDYYDLWQWFRLDQTVRPSVERLQWLMDQIAPPPPEPEKPAASAGNWWDEAE